MSFQGEPWFSMIILTILFLEPALALPWFHHYGYCSMKEGNEDHAAAALSLFCNMLVDPSGVKPTDTTIQLLKWEL
ncbi:hypothetical protein Ahy_A02g007010 isoform C [Arachis hypogaea]|uniref:Uncharacterized protein n=1 Tax=Arachis hypogaea TaxID=3818 RepID=A0A445EBE0_ARAHY|nr:hypothetical protein Ahy_A02g007010 isoform C [Arachis hypogaea]